MGGLLPRVRGDVGRTFPSHHLMPANRRSDGSDGSWTSEGRGSSHAATRSDPPIRCRVRASAAGMRRQRILSSWTCRRVLSFCDHFEPELWVDEPLSTCPACVEIGGTWVHLRQCLPCGHTGCCGLSPTRHSTAHYHETGHPMIRTAEAAEDWQWCFEDHRLY